MQDCSHSPHWSYCSIALSHRNIFWRYHQWRINKDLFQFLPWMAWSRSDSYQQYWNPRRCRIFIRCYPSRKPHTMDLLWEKFQWILPLYVKPISFQSKASVVCSVTAAIFIDFCLKKLNAFSQHFGQKHMNIWIPQNKLLPEISLNDAASTYCEKS